MGNPLAILNNIGLLYHEPRTTELKLWFSSYFKKFEHITGVYT